MEKQTFLRKFVRSQLFILLVVLVAACTFFTITSEGSFLSSGNIIVILNTMVVVSTLTIGATLMMISGKADLSTSGIGMLSAMVMASLLQSGYNWALGILGGLIVGAIVGLVNAFMMNDLRFAPFVATLATSQVCRGIMYIVCFSKGTTAFILIKDKAVGFIGTGKIFNNTVPFSIIIMLVLLIVYGVILKQTKFGRKIYLVGGNPNAAMLSGVNPKKMSYILCVNSAVLGAVAGMLMAANLKSATTTAMQYMEFSGITSAILGGVSFGGGGGGMGGAFVGLLLLTGFTNGLVTVGIDVYFQIIWKGVLLLIALSMDYLRTRQALKRVSS